MMEESSMFVPMEASEFKPRLDQNECQYCGFTSNRKQNLDLHINGQHEMKTWYKCNICEHVTLHPSSINTHLKVVHKSTKKGFDINLLIVTDQQEVAELKQSWLDKRKRLKSASCFMPIEKSKFKPRTNIRMCQYCDYKASKCSLTDVHINVNHELNVWYQCKICKFSSLISGVLKNHMLLRHDQHVTSKQMSDLIIKDEHEIEQLKMKKIEENRAKREVDQLRSKSNITNNEPKFIPVNRVDFKSSLNPRICQYCGFIGLSHKIISEHVNSMHEMTTWYKCQNCNFSSVYERSLRIHLKKIHSTAIKRDKASISKFTVNNDEEIETLKRERVIEKTSQEETYPGAKQQIDELMPAIKDEIEIEEHSLEQDNDNMSGDNNGDGVDNLSDHDEERLVGPSW